jgi:hypothetical protein
MSMVSSALNLILHKYMSFFYLKYITYTHNTHFSGFKTFDPAVDISKRDKS